MWSLWIRKGRLSIKSSCSRLTRSLEKIVSKCELSAMMEKKKARLVRDFILTINGARAIEPTARCDIAEVGSITGGRLWWWPERNVANTFTTRTLVSVMARRCCQAPKMFRRYGTRQVQGISTRVEGNEEHRATMIMIVRTKTRDRGDLHKHRLFQGQCCTKLREDLRGATKCDVMQNRQGPWDSTASSRTIGYLPLDPHTTNDT